MKERKQNFFTFKNQTHCFLAFGAKNDDMLFIPDLSTLSNLDLAGPCEEQYKIGVTDAWYSQRNKRVHQKEKKFFIFRAHLEVPSFLSDAKEQRTFVSLSWFSALEL